MSVHLFLYFFLSQVMKLTKNDNIDILTRSPVLVKIFKM